MTTWSARFTTNIIRLLFCVLNLSSTHAQTQINTEWIDDPTSNVWDEQFHNGMSSASVAGYHGAYKGNSDNSCANYDLEQVTLTKTFTCSEKYTIIQARINHCDTENTDYFELRINSSPKISINGNEFNAQNYDTVLNAANCGTSWYYQDITYTMVEISTFQMQLYIETNCDNDFWAINNIKLYCLNDSDFIETPLNTHSTWTDDFVLGNPRFFGWLGNDKILTHSDSGLQFHGMYLQQSASFRRYFKCERWSNVEIQYKFYSCMSNNHASVAIYLDDEEFDYSDTDDYAANSYDNILNNALDQGYFCSNFWKQSIITVGTSKKFEVDANEIFTVTFNVSSLHGNDPIAIGDIEIDCVFIPTYDPTSDPTTDPTINPTIAPSISPSIIPTQPPSISPSFVPTQPPSLSPSTAPTQPPSISPSNSPSISPSISPSENPSLTPSISPTQPPSISPTSPPTISPSISPTSPPSITPTLNPSITPSLTPTTPPSLSPSFTPTTSPSNIPSISPSLSPSLNPSSIPSLTPSISPSLTPTISPSISPSLTPTSPPSLAPSLNPSIAPSLSPSLIPSLAPSLSPTSKREYLHFICDYNDDTFTVYGKFVTLFQYAAIMKNVTLSTIVDKTYRATNYDETDINQYAPWRKAGISYFEFCHVFSTSLNDECPIYHHQANYIAIAVFEIVADTQINEYRDHLFDIMSTESFRIKLSQNMNLALDKMLSYVDRKNFEAVKITVIDWENDESQDANIDSPKSSNPETLIIVIVVIGIFVVVIVVSSIYFRKRNQAPVQVQQGAGIELARNRDVDAQQHHDNNLDAQRHHDNIEFEFDDEKKEQDSIDHDNIEYQFDDEKKEQEDSIDHDNQLEGRHATRYID